jgi:hypothetical protein
MNREKNVPQQLAEKKGYTPEEIRKMAPGYRGKQENFDPSRAGKKKAPAPQRLGPKSPAPPLMALERNKNPTPQRNDPILSETIFGVDIAVTEIAPKPFSC